MATVTLTGRQKIVEFLDDLNTVGVSEAAAVVTGTAATSSVYFLACTEPDADWWWMNDDSGDSWSYERYARVDGFSDEQWMILFPDWAMRPLAALYNEREAEKQ